MAKNNHDIIIVGGGLAGLTLACLLGTQKFSVLCLDREDVPDTLKTSFDGRTTAISYFSHLVMKDAGLWDKLEPLSCPINDIKILDGASPVLMNFLSEEIGDRAFGHIVENRDLRALLHERIRSLKNVTHLSPVTVTSFDADTKIATVTSEDGRKFSASILIGADGKNSALRKFLNISTHGWSYDQTAVVCCVEHENPHNNTAIEHFRKEGPFAILPMRDREGKHMSSLVWTVEAQQARSLLACHEDVFNAALSARFPAEYGAVSCVSKRFSYPLSLQHAHAYTGERTALIAEAAHAMHPIAGQGLNMGMRDIRAISDLLIAARDNKTDLGSKDLLQTFQQRRRFDNTMMMAATDSLNKLFSNDMPFIGPLRRIGVSLVSRIPSAKNFFMHQAMGLKSVR